LYPAISTHQTHLLYVRGKQGRWHSRHKGVANPPPVRSPSVLPTFPTKLLPLLRQVCLNAITHPSQGSIICWFCLHLHCPGTSSVPITTVTVVIPSFVHPPCTPHRSAGPPCILRSWSSKCQCNVLRWPCCTPVVGKKNVGIPTHDAVPSLACVSLPCSKPLKYGTPLAMPGWLSSGSISCCCIGGHTAQLPCRTWH
jgi:hypothetical protein